MITSSTILAVDPLMHGQEFATPKIDNRPFDLRVLLILIIVATCAVAVLLNNK